MTSKSNSKTTVLMASLVFPYLFFPESSPTTQMLQSLATFAVAFFARPLGSAFFGHFGDKIGRKATLVAALLTMGLSTIMIGLLPSYHSVGIFFGTNIACFVQVWSRFWLRR